MKYAIILVTIAFATACGDTSTEDTSMTDAGSQTSPEAGPNSGDDAGASIECDPETEVAFETGCSDEGLRFIFSTDEQRRVSVRSSPYPDAIGADQGTPRERTVTDQCYVLDFVGAEPGTPTDLPCFDAGALSLTAGETTVEIPRTAEDCYDGFGTLPTDEVSIEFSGGADIEPASFDIELPAQLDLEVVEDANGGAVVTLLNPRDEEEPSWRLYWFGFGDSLSIVCEPVDDRITFRSEDLQAIEALGPYGSPVAYRFENTGAYVGDGKGILVIMSTVANMDWYPW